MSENHVHVLVREQPFAFLGMVYEVMNSVFVSKHQCQIANYVLFTQHRSTMRRTAETARPVSLDVCQYVRWKALTEIDVGICDGM